MRDYQLEAVHSVQNSIKNGNDRFLLEMATGTGKTLTSCAIIKMFLRLYKVNRVLFLVDRLELESQAQKEFDQVLKNDFRTVIWKENQGDWKKAEIVVSTVQSFISKNKYKRIFNQMILIWLSLMKHIVHLEQEAEESLNISMVLN